MRYKPKPPETFEEVFDALPVIPSPDPSQAERIIERFGGARALSRIFAAMGINRTPSSIYKWTYPREKGGTDGIIPTSAWPDLLSAARIHGILISEEEFDPRNRPYRKEPKNAYVEADLKEKAHKELMEKFK
jgi:hypothetical protein